MGLRAAQDVLEKRKISFAAGKRNPDHSAFSLVIIPTELSRLPSVISRPNVVR